VIGDPPSFVGGVHLRSTWSLSQSVASGVPGASGSSKIGKNIQAISEVGELLPADQIWCLDLGRNSMPKSGTKMKMLLSFQYYELSVRLCSNSVT
jgi:hypothetical protein